eukprot:g6451.t1
MCNLVTLSREGTKAAPGIKNTGNEAFKGVNMVHTTSVLPCRFVGLWRGASPLRQCPCLGVACRAQEAWKIGNSRRHRNHRKRMREEAQETKDREERKKRKKKQKEQARKESAKKKQKTEAGGTRKPGEKTGVEARELEEEEVKEVEEEEEVEGEEDEEKEEDEEEERSTGRKSKGKGEKKQKGGKEAERSTRRKSNGKGKKKQKKEEEDEEDEDSKDADGAERKTIVKADTDMNVIMKPDSEPSSKKERTEVVKKATGSQGDNGEAKEGQACGTAQKVTVTFPKGDTLTGHTTDTLVINCKSFGNKLVIWTEIASPG